MEDDHGSGSLMDVDVTAAPAAGAERAQEHVASYQVDTSLLRYIVGTGGTTKAKIESESAAELNIPSKSAAGKFNAVIIVKGPTQEAVNKAMKAIDEVVDQAVRSPNYQYTHFISLPLALHGSLVDELVSFEETVLGTVNGGDEDVEISDDEEAETISTSVNPKKAEGDLGIDKSIFVNAKTFHLTVLMLKLWNEDRIKTAMDVLQKTRVPVLLALDSRAVEIDLNGVDCMRSNPAKTHVLYAKVQEAGQESRLMAACKVLIDAFTQAGLVMDRDKDQPLKLHATLMNTSHRKRGKRGKSWKRKPFDARQIIEQYGAKQWGRYLITEAHLSQRFAYDGNGYYHCCSSIQFP